MVLEEFPHIRHVALPIEPVVGLEPPTNNSHMGWSAGHRPQLVSMSVIFRCYTKAPQFRAGVCVNRAVRGFVGRNMQTDDTISCISLNAAEYDKHRLSAGSKQKKARFIRSRGTSGLRITKAVSTTYTYEVSGPVSGHMGDESTMLDCSMERKDTRNSALARSEQMRQPNEASRWHRNKIWHSLSLDVEFWADTVGGHARRSLRGQEAIDKGVIVKYRTTGTQEDVEP